MTERFTMLFEKIRKLGTMYPPAIRVLERIVDRWLTLYDRRKQPRT